MSKSIKAGDIIELDAPATVGHEQRGRRPALVISADELASTLSLALVCAITTHGGRTARPRNELEIPIAADLPVTGVVLCYQVQTVDVNARHAVVKCRVPRATLLLVRSRLRTLLGMQ